MSKYKIWDKQSTIYTLVGETISPEQWIERYPWAAINGVKMIVGGGVINGAVAMEFGATVDMYRKMGCDFSACVTDQDFLDAIEDFEDNPPVSTEPTTEERIASALEFQSMMMMPDAV